MKKILLYICIFVYSVSLHSAEPLLKFYLKDGTPKEYNIYEMQNVSFLKSILSYTMRIHYNDNSTKSDVNIRVVDSISFQNNDMVLYLSGIPFSWSKLSQIDSIIFVWNTCQEITIGIQNWMCHNLDVAQYRNGDPIPEVTDPIQWQNLKTGAWCYYNNDPAMGAIYGKLYNWYAVNDPRGLAPTGWQIPTDAQWDELSIYLSGDSESGAKLKSTGTIEDGDGLWNSPNEATNEAGFTALPAGYRHYFDGAFDYLGGSCYWWTASSSTGGGAWDRTLFNFATNIKSDSYDKAYGFSVRCIKEK